MAIISTESTSLTVMWQPQSAISVFSFNISYFNTRNKECFNDTNTITGISSDKTRYNLTNLQEGTKYSITVIAILSDNSSTEGSATSSTLPAGNCLLMHLKNAILHFITVPSSPPSSIRVVLVAFDRIKIQWGPVNCSHQNGKVSGYKIKYIEEGSTMTCDFTLNFDSLVVHIDHLKPSTNYFIAMAAINNAGTGVFSSPIKAKTAPSELL